MSCGMFTTTKVLKFRVIIMKAQTFVVFKSIISKIERFLKE